MTPEETIRQAYREQKAKAGGAWYSYVARADPDGVLRPVVEDDADHVVAGYSVQKLAIATAVLDKVDRGLLDLDRKITLTADLVAGGSGSYHLQTVYGDELTIAGFLTAMLLVSDNTSVRLCGLVCPAAEINEILAAKGFVHTRVEPQENPNRFGTGVTTPRETQELLLRLAGRTLLSAGSCDFVLGIIRWVNGYMDGIRRNMSSGERSRIGTKPGQDFNTPGAARHEAGILFGANGSPALVFGFFAEALPGLDNYGATLPAVEALAILGRTMFDTIGAP